MRAAGKPRAAPGARALHRAPDRRVPPRQRARRESRRRARRAHRGDASARGGSRPDRRQCGLAPAPFEDLHARLRRTAPGARLRRAAHLSNLFMTFAWYGHLKNLGGRPWWIAALVSWGIALFEYLLQVPANRIGFTALSLAQLKIMQEVITLVRVRAVRGALHGRAGQARLPVGRRCASWAPSTSSSADEPIVRVSSTSTSRSRPGYLLSYLYRTVNAVISPELTRELALTRRRSACSRARISSRSRRCRFRSASCSTATARGASSRCCSRSRRSARRCSRRRETSPGSPSRARSSAPACARA